MHTYHHGAVFFNQSTNLPAVWCVDPVFADATKTEH